MKFTKILILAAFAFPSSIIWGQSSINTNDTLSLSLSQIWLKAELFSRTVLIKKEAVNISQEEVRDAQTERLPELGIGGSVEKATNIPIYENGLFSSPKQHEVIHTLYRLGTDMNLNIYNGGKLNLEILKDKTLHQLSVLQKDKTISDIHLTAASLYLELQKSFIFRDLMIEHIADQEKQLAQIKAFHKNGIVLKNDLLRVELTLSKKKMALVEIQNDILIATQKLNILIGEPDNRVVQPDNLSDPKENPLASYEEVLENALNHSFSYQISAKKTGLSEIHLRQIQANVRPRLTLYGEFYYANPQIFLYPYNPYWYSLGIGGLKASFPLSSFYQNKHKEKSARWEVLQEEEIHKDVEDGVRQQVKEAYLRYTEALLQIDVAKTNKAQADENARITKNAYFNQAALITDLLDADIQALQARFDLASAKITAQYKYYTLQNIIGIL
ncbi:MAG: TolC family protein [Flavisolibacter sp.]